jgi:hypothetical protein
MSSHVNVIPASIDNETPYWKPSAECRICGEPTTGESTAYLCGVCKRVLGRNLTAMQKRVRFGHMRGQWERHGEYRCEYTGVRLELQDASHVLYREWEHATPGDEESVVLAAAVVNRMKCYLTVAEFRVMVIELARHFLDPQQPFDPAALPSRPVPPSLQASS